MTSIIEEARENKRKVYYCFVEFCKAFDIVPRHLLVDRLKDLDHPPLVVSLVMTLYDTIISKVRMRDGETEEVQSTMGVKQGYPLSPTLFGLYIDELEKIISNSLGVVDGCLLFGVSIAILLFVDDIILMSYPVRGL